MSVFPRRHQGVHPTALRLRSLQAGAPAATAPATAGRAVPPAVAGGGRAMEPPDWVEPPDVADDEPDALTGPRTTGEPTPEIAPDDVVGASPGRPWSAWERVGVFVRRSDPGLPGARALAVVGVVGVLLAGALLWSSRPRAQSVPAAVATPAGAAVAAQPMPDPAPGASAGSVPPSAVVHVAGRVRRPGVVTLPARARVVEAIEAAGGLRPGVSADGLNLARPVVDGEQLLVGVTPPGGPGGPGSALPGASAVAGAGGAAPPGTGPGPPAGGAGALGADGRLDLNTATLEQFQQLPGVGPVLAQRILDHRTRIGGFRSVDQLQEVTGIGARRFAELKDRVRV